MTAVSSQESSSDLAADPASETSLSFGKYRLTRLLARGGMGEVYLARLVGELGFEKRLVIKTILPHLAAKPRFVEMFAAEAKTAVALSHGNIVPIYELGRTGDTFYIVMGHVDGPSVSTMLEAYRSRRAAPPLGVALHIMRGVLAGLAYAHTAEPGRPAVVHRDITPRNILVDRSGQVRIVDFGIAAPADAQLDVRGGSSGYMAPEQARGEAVDPRADVFSAGCLLYELVTLERAFPKDGVWSTPDLSGLPSELAAVLRTALATDAAQRPADAGALLDRLAPALTRHAPSFGDGALAAELRALFPSGWEHATQPAAAGATPPGGAARQRPSTETFATRLTVITRAQPVPGASTPARRWPRFVAIAAVAAVATTWLVMRSAEAPSQPAEARAVEAPPPTLADASRPATPRPSPTIEAPPRRDPPAIEPTPPAPVAPRTSAHALRVEPADATITIDGRTTANDGEIELPSDRSATVVIKASGHVARSFVVDATHPLPRAVVLRPAKAAGEGFLRVYAASVPWAEVRVDGKKVGTTPTPKLPIGAGAHRVVVTCIPDACASRQVLYQDSVTIKDGQLFELRAQ